ncbi:MAG: 2-oxo acid dehydrogenase subunit E2 [Oscillospiraceae bacterium]|nr:2-oxo acid dehydrogenase subunit E2 [Oscillospiraceae bacterium]
MEQRPKKRGDRFDGYWLRDEAPALGQFMAYLMPNRADNEAHINVDVDCRPLDAFLAKKNEGRTEDKYTYFHLFLAAAVKCFVLRPRMNRFISGNRLYMRDHISVSFVVKKKFEDKAEEGLAYKHYDENDTIDTLHESIMEEIHQCRREDVLDNSTDMMTKLLKLPRWMLRIIVNILFALDRNGKVPYDLIKADPNYSSIFMTNLGSIGMDSGYHHLNNWGTNSFFVMIGKKHLAPEWHEDGSCTVRPVISLGLTLDERIGDGYYYAGTVRLLHKLLENPELLELPFSTPVEY